MSGYHRLTYDGGEVFEGNWDKNGLKHGIGRLKFADGSIYEGKFKEGVFAGLGKLTLQDGSKYEGQFASGKYSGYGTYTRADGMCFEGHFQDGRVSGNGRVTYVDGTHGRPRSEGYFEGNRLVRREVSTEAVTQARLFSEEARRVKLTKSKAKSLPH